MAFATRTLVDTTTSSTSGGTVTILLDISAYNASATALDADSLSGFANGAKLNICICLPFHFFPN